MRPGAPAPDLRAPIVLRPPGPPDGRLLWAMAGECGLDRNSPYAYVLWGDHHRGSSLVAVRGQELVGFVLGFRIPDAPTEVFVWQIAVSPSLRGEGLGSWLLDELVRTTRAELIEATVTPSNEGSQRLFRSLAARHGGRVTVGRGYDASLFPDDHEEELRFRIDLRPGGPADPPGATRGETYLGDL